MTLDHSSVRILCKYFADSFHIYLKTHNFHWNVTGPLFFTLHKMFEEQYEELFLSLDNTAERIRTFDAVVPGSFTQMKEFCSLNENKNFTNARDMITELFENHSHIVQNLKTWINECANDALTQDYLLERLAVHEKMKWMLRSSI